MKLILRRSDYTERGWKVAKQQAETEYAYWHRIKGGIIYFYFATDYLTWLRQK